jgi:hypothetical protein
MADHDYRATLDRLEAGSFIVGVDAPAIMALLGYEAAHHGRLGMACRPIGESHWQSLPNFQSADDFELWVLNKRAGTLDDIGRREEGGGFYVSYSDPEHGNDYGYGRRLGTAMWAAFVRLAGEVFEEEG